MRTKIKSLKPPDDNGIWSKVNSDNYNWRELSWLRFGHWRLVPRANDCAGTWYFSFINGIDLSFTNYQYQNHIVPFKTYKNATKASNLFKLFFIIFLIIQNQQIINYARRKNNSLKTLKHGIKKTGSLNQNELHIIILSKMPWGVLNLALLRFSLYLKSFTQPVFKDIFINKDWFPVTID